MYDLNFFVVEGRPLIWYPGGRPNLLALSQYDPAGPGYEWKYEVRAPAHADEDAIRLRGWVPREHDREAAMKTTERYLLAETQWFHVREGVWFVDRSKLREAARPLVPLGWLRGWVRIEPAHALVEYDSRDELGLTDWPVFGDHSVVEMTLTRTDAQETPPTLLPPELLPAVSRFRHEHPDPSRVGFVMMSFHETRLHHSILRAIKAVLATNGLEAVRADERAYSDDLFANVRTYMYGCGFGIAVFERLTVEDFNPNVSLEVGHMVAQLKPVCLLKDKTLRTLPTDLVGRLYQVFDPQDPEGTIPVVLERWLRDKGII